MSYIARSTCLAGIVLGSAAAAACAPSSNVRPAPSDPVAELSAGFSPSVRHDLETLRRATESFQDLSAAQAAGYPTGTPACIADSTMGGMGRHYFDRASYDDTLSIDRPEMLLYQPIGNDRLELVAVEYVVPFQLRSPTGPPPRLFGQEFRKHDGFKYWYLHVWAWEKNPAGLFADWNPNVKCPARPAVDAQTDSAPPVAYPEGYRTWTHVKSALISPSHRTFATQGGFQHIYANVAAMSGYRTRAFPEGSVVVVEWLAMRDNDGAFLEGPVRQVDVMVKDSVRFASSGAWGFQRFVGDSKTERASTPSPMQCFACHDRLKQDGLVLSRYRQ